MSNDAYGVAKNRLYLGDDYRAEIQAALREDELTKVGELVSPEHRRHLLARRLEPVAAILDVAEQCYRDAANRLKSLGENNLLSRAYRSLGDVLRFCAILDNSVDLHDESLRYLRKALEIEISGQLRRRLPTAYESLARLEWDTGYLAAAANYFSSALGILADPKLKQLDTSGKNLRARCARARDLLLWQPGSMQSGEDERLPEPWRQTRQRLIDTLLEALHHGKYRPVAASVVHRDWANALETVEHEPGSRYPAQNLLSMSLSTAMSAGAQGDTATIYNARHRAFMQGGGATRDGTGTVTYRGICWSSAVMRAMNNPSSEELCRNQVRGALHLLREKPKDYSLLLRKYELPYGFLVKRAHVLIEVPAELASRFGLRLTEGMTKSSMLCYHIKDNTALSAGLIALFGELAPLCEQNEDVVSGWLENLLTGNPPVPQAANAL